MNWKTLSIISSAAAALVLYAPAANAHGRAGGGGGGGAHASGMRGSAGRTSTSTASRQHAEHRGDWDRHDRDREHDGWRDRDGHYWGGYGYYGFGYPYYGYPFGYPYYASSASLYYFGNQGYNQSGYQANRGNGGNVVVDVQQRLSRAGYYHGAIDGINGSGTHRAIRAYERSHGLPADGEIDRDLLNRMGLS